MLIILALASNGLKAQCVGGFFAGTITPVTAWQAVSCAWAGDYYEFNATAGIPYTFSLCPPTPGSTPFNSQLTILNSLGVPQAGGYNDNACVGGGSHIQSWIAPATGTYRVLINQNNCVTNTTCCNLGFKQENPIGPGRNCADPYIISSLPLALNNMATCGYGNEYTQFNSACATSYLNGEDFVFRYTTSGPECIEIRTSNTFTWVGIMIFNGCPNAGGTSCLGGAVSGTGSPSVVNFNLPGAGTYYFVIDTWPAPNCTPFDVTISNCPIPGPGLTCANPRIIPSLPYAQNNLTTCAHGDDYQPTDACASQYMGGEDFTFTYNSPGNECINIRLANTSTWVGVHVTTLCPNAPGSVCVASGGNPSGNTHLRDVNLVAAGTYFITVSTWPNPQCTPFDIVVERCPPECSRNGPAGDACAGATNVTGMDTICGTSEASYNIDTAGTNLAAQFCGSLDNESFFSFVADTTDMEIEFLSITNCVYDYGLQAQVYSTTNCTNFTPVSNCWNPLNTNPGSLYLTGLTVGQTYYLLIDGWAEDVCDYLIAINGATTPLPVTFGEIFAHLNGSEVTLAWETQTEFQNSGFVVERGHAFQSKEHNAVNWERVGYVEGLGTTSSSNSYHFTENLEFDGRPWYYRLRQVDFDGKSSYSDVVAVTPDMPTRHSFVRLYPNPSSQSFHLEYLIGDANSEARLELLSLTGEKVKDITLRGQGQGYHSDEIEVSNLLNGMYLYNLRIGNKSFPGKITVIH